MVRQPPSSPSSAPDGSEPRLLDPREWARQWVFPATRFYEDEQTGERRRHHLHESVLQRAVRQAGGAQRTQGI
jgi:hypothetical protein